MTIFAKKWYRYGKKRTQKAYKSAEKASKP